MEQASLTVRRSAQRSDSCAIDQNRLKTLHQSPQGNNALSQYSSSMMYHDDPIPSRRWYPHMFRVEAKIDPWTYHRSFSATVLRISLTTLSSQPHTAEAKDHDHPAALSVWHANKTRHGIRVSAPHLFSNPPNERQQSRKQAETRMRHSATVTAGLALLAVEFGWLLGHYPRPRQPIWFHFLCLLSRAPCMQLEPSCSSNNASSCPSLGAAEVAGCSPGVCWCMDVSAGLDLLCVGRQWSVGVAGIIGQG